MMPALYKHDYLVVPSKLYRNSLCLIKLVSWLFIGLLIYAQMIFTMLGLFCHPEHSERSLCMAKIRLLAVARNERISCLLICNRPFV